MRLPREGQNEHLALGQKTLLGLVAEDLQITQDLIEAVTVDQGKVLRLECKGVGFPYARYIWFRGKAELSGGYDGVLTINSVG